MDGETDSDLVRLAWAGNKAAFGQLIDRYAAMVRGLIYRVTGDSETVPDLAQEALLQAYLSLDSLRDESRFRSWLYGITLNVCRVYLRSRKVNVWSLEAMLGGIYRDPGPTLEEMVERLELRRVVWEAIEALSPTNRAAILLVYYDDFGLREAADLLDISIPALKVRLHRSRHHLQANLKEHLTPEKQGDKPMIPVKVVDVWRKEGMPLMQIVLYDEAGQQAMLIWVGEVEGTFILQGLLHCDASRPMTPVFIARLLQAADASIEQVLINTLQDDVFYATVRLRSGDQIREIDARPSDALALAIQVEAPIYVSSAVMEQAGRTIPPGYLPTGSGMAALQTEWQARQSEFNKAVSAAMPSGEQEKQQTRARDEQAILSRAFGKSE